MSELIVNGQSTPFREGESLRALLQRVGVDPEQRGVAVAIGDEVVPRSAWGERELQPAERVEVLHAVQGG